MSVGRDSCGDQDLKPSWSRVMSWYFGMAEMSQKTGVNRSRGQQKDRDPLSHTAAMEELDGDEVRVSSRGRSAERDIVQFVPFRDYIDRSGNQVLSMARLAKDVLAEIPDQLLSFMRSRAIEPRPAVPASGSQSHSTATTTSTSISSIAKGRNTHA
ncbi:unnamed protein product [Arctogadus glacialis]